MKRLERENQKLVVENQKMITENNKMRAQIDELTKTIEDMKKKKGRSKNVRSYHMHFKTRMNISCPFDQILLIKLEPAPPRVHRVRCPRTELGNKVQMTNS